MNPTIGPLPADGPRPSVKDGLRAIHALIADFGRQIRLALGVKGVVWASVAGLVGVLCCAISFVVVALSLDSGEVEEAQGRVATYALADQTFRDFMRAVHDAGLGAPPPPNGRLLVHEGWQRSNATLDAMCVHGRSDAPARLTQLCAALPSIRQRLGPSIEAFDPLVNPLPASAVDELLALGRRINDLMTHGMRGTGVLVRTMSDQFAWAIFALTVSTTGFAGAGMILIVLVGRASMLHHEQWQNAAASAEQANRLARQLAEQVAKGEQRRLEYEALVDSLSDLVVKVDAGTGTTTFASAASLDLLGMPADRLLGRSIFDHVVPEDRESVMAAARSSLRGAGSKVAHVQYRVRGADGLERHVEARFRKVRGPDSRTIVSGVIRDIEEHVQLDERLQQQAGQLRSETTRLRAIVESTGTMIAMTDADLNLVMVNREYQRFWDVSADQVIGRNLRDTSIGTALTPAVHQRWLSGASKEPVRYTRKKFDTEGREYVSSVTVSPVFDETDALRQIVFLSTDDTEWYQAEQAMFHSERLVLLGEMAATVAHEIIQPLQVIELARTSAQEEIAQAAENGVAFDDQYVDARLARIGQQVERANRIVDDLRSFVRADDQAKPAPFLLATAVQAAVDLTRHGLGTARVQVSVTLPEPSPAINGHVGRLEQVLVNLINNARDAGARKIDVVGSTASSETAPNILILVEDDGPGIPDEILPLLFNKFISTKPRGQGTGLGLRICRRIVEDMGGSIAAANRRHRGARFEILLPAMRDNNDKQSRGDFG